MMPTLETPLSELFAPFDEATWHFRESENSFHATEPAEMPARVSQLLYLIGLIESRGAERGRDYVIELDELPDIRQIVTLHCVGDFFSKHDDRLGYGVYRPEERGFSVP